MHGKNHNNSPNTCHREHATSAHDRSRAVASREQLFSGILKAALHQVGCVQGCIAIDCAFELPLTLVALILAAAVFLCQCGGVQITEHLLQALTRGSDASAVDTDLICCVTEAATALVPEAVVAFVGANLLLPLKIDVVTFPIITPVGICATLVSTHCVLSRRFHFVERAPFTAGVC